MSTLPLFITSGDFERRRILAEDRSDERVGEECADLVLDRRDRLVAEARVVGGVFGLPEGSHDRIVAADDEPIAIGLVDQQAGESEQGLILGVEQEPQRMAEDIFEARPPALRPDVLERRDDVRGGRRALGLGDAREGIVGEGVGRVGRVEIDHVLAALLRREARDMLARVAVRDRESRSPRRPGGRRASC